MVYFYIIPEGEYLPRRFSLEEFEALTQVQYQPTLCFETLKTQERVVRACRSPKLKRNISAPQKWLGYFYSQEIALGFLHNDLILSWIAPQIGYGVFASKEIPSKALIGNYSGELKERRWLKRNTSDYSFFYGAGNFTTSFFIDAEKKGSLVRFINHSDDPNLETIPVVVEGILYIALRATRPIAKGAQLTYDYGSEYWRDRGDPSGFTYLLNADQLQFEK